MNSASKIRKSREGIGYIRIIELPEEIQDTFDEWLLDYTRPLIEEEEDFFGCAYPADYERFLKSDVAIQMKLGEPTHSNILS